MKSFVISTIGLVIFFSGGAKAQAQANTNINASTNPNINASPNPNINASTNPNTPSSDCSLDSETFFWDIEIATSPRIDGISDHANEGMEPELRQTLQKRGYKVSTNQRAEAGTFQGDYDYKSAGRYLLVSGAVEGSGDVEVLLDLSIYKDGSLGIGRLISNLRKTLAQLDQKLLDQGEDFAQTAGIKIPGVIFLGGAKERVFFGIGQAKAEREILSQIPVCKP